MGRDNISTTLRVGTDIDIQYVVLPHDVLVVVIPVNTEKCNAMFLVNKKKSGADKVLRIEMLAVENAIKRGDKIRGNVVSVAKPTTV